MSKKKRILLSLFIIVLICGAYLYLYNQEYFAKGAQTGTQYFTGDMHLENWQEQDGAYVSLEDPQIIIEGIDGKVDYVDINAQIDGDIQPTVFSL